MRSLTYAMHRATLTGTGIRADSAEQKLQQANITITGMQERQQSVAALDAKHTKELADANAKNDALQRKLDAGGRLRVAGKCSVSGTDKPPGTGSVGDAATVELSQVAGRNVLGIRAGILSGQEKLRYLQDYISTQCLR